jgi:hypothetical protein
MKGLRTDQELRMAGVDANIFGRHVGLYVSTFLETLERKRSILSLGFDLNLWNARALKRTIPIRFSQARVVSCRACRVSRVRFLHTGVGSPSSAHAPAGKKGKRTEAKLITEAEKETIIGHVAEVHSTPREF